MSRNRRPKYRLLITEKVNKRSKTFAGVAFDGNFNTLNICLNPGVRLDWRDMDSVWLTLVPYTGDYNAPEVDPGAAPVVEEPAKVEQAETSTDDDKPTEGPPPSRDDDFPF
jgi:hypothetical protein